MGRPALLFLTPYPPCREKAGHNFTRLLLRDLAARYDVDLLYFRSAHEADYIPEAPGIRIVARFVIGPFGKLANVLRHPLTFPLFSARYSSRAVRAIRRAVAGRDYAAVYLDHSQMFMFVRVFEPSVRIVMMAHDFQSQRYLRKFGRTVSRVAALTERRFVTRRNARVLAFSEKDAEIARRDYGIRAIRVGFYLDDCVRSARPDRIGDYFVFFAAWSRPENSGGLAWFLDDVVPSLDSDLRFVVIGGGMSEPLRKRMSATPGFEYRGFVDDPYPVIANARAVVAPLFRGAGVKVKVIESLAVGTPVIGTDVALEGLPEGFSDALFECSSPGEFATALASVPTDPGFRIALKERFLSAYCGRSAAETVDGLIRDWRCE